MTTAASTVLEQDFTVEGRKGTLGCPFSRPIPEEMAEAASQLEGPPDPTPHHSADPICAAMYEETNSMPAPSAQESASKCPIRYMDQHSPEEIAHYLETHKHELPRSHEVCLRRYQKSEDHIRKLDAKYGNLVNMVEGLGRIHQPMLPEQDTRPQSDVERASNSRVETWAQTVSATVTEDPEQAAVETGSEDGEERLGHFDRPLKEVRVGESPSRPWGISVPVYDTPLINGEDPGRPESPPPAPVQMPSTPMADPTATPGQNARKCPFDHTKLQANGMTPTMPKHEEKTPKPLGTIPSHQPFTASATEPTTHATATSARSAQPAQPTFLNPAELAAPKSGGAPQMLFTGPVFIGYPMEQAIQFMQQFQQQQR